MLFGISIENRKSAETMASAVTMPSSDGIPSIDGMKKVAITFDDGPNPDYTEMLLAGLKERGVKATFFCWGKRW